MRTIFKLLLLTIAALFLEFLFHGFAWSPSFLFLIVLFTALKWKESAGAMAGFLTGAFYAELYREPPGLASLCLILTGYLAGKIAPFLMDAPRAVIFVFAFLICVYYHFLGSVFITIFYNPFWEIRLQSALASGIVFSLSYNPLHRFFTKKRI
ncbi:rod shape-determining protein MreD [Candidatus Sumerlaeota bacterium]|nr:rod shape-determining protein MreD [Candidatus Sumerlaeota bacterium]